MLFMILKKFTRRPSEESTNTTVRRVVRMTLFAKLYFGVSRHRRRVRSISYYIMCYGSFGLFFRFKHQEEHVEPQ